MVLIASPSARTRLSPSTRLCVLHMCCSYFSAADFFLHDRCRVLTVPGSARAVGCAPASATECFLHALLHAHQVRVLPAALRFKMLPLRVKVSLVRPEDVAESSAASARELFPERCLYGGGAYGYAS